MVTIDRALNTSKCIIILIYKSSIFVRSESDITESYARIAWDTTGDVQGRRGKLSPAVLIVEMK